MTAVEWLIYSIEGLEKSWVENIINTDEYFSNIEWVKIKAKEMQKQEIITAYAFGHNDGCRYMTNEKQEFEHGEAYFAETFKQDL